MKAKDLRIGNLVNTPVGAVKVSKIEENDFFFKYGFRSWRASKMIYQIKPIPLTEEWLLKFGFSTKVDPENVHYKKEVNNEFNEHFVINKKVAYHVFYIQHKDCNDVNNFTTQIKYVNQLQNLYFALTGEELKHEI
jgi:hypothetical protein